MSAFVNGCINVNDVLRQHCLLDRDDQRVYTAQFLRESLFMLLVAMDVYRLTELHRSEISCIVSCLATS